MPAKFREKGLVQTLFTFKLYNFKAQAFEAEDLIDICMMYINANSEGKLLESQKHLATQSLIIVSAFAKTGVIAVIDEATGYINDKNRAKDELQKFLSSFMRTEVAAYVKRFDDSFFEMIYKLRGWTWTYTYRHPSIVGQLINDLVYARLAPLILSELRKKNPVIDYGTSKHREHYHHQFLTEEVGIPKLQYHLSSLELLARVSNYDWCKFMDMVDLAFPKQEQQMKLFYYYDFDEKKTTPKDSDDFDKGMNKIIGFNIDED